MENDTSIRSGIVLFAHGSRDALWAEPFEKLAQKVRALRAAAGDDGPVALAYLELMAPSLGDAVAAQVAAGAAAITIVPVFLGQGGHLRRDLPRLVDACRAAHPGVAIRCTNAAGEDDGVLAALARFCVM